MSTYIFSYRILPSRSGGQPRAMTTTCIVWGISGTSSVVLGFFFNHPRFWEKHYLSIHSVSIQTWVLGTKLRSSGRATATDLKSWAISPASQHLSFQLLLPPQPTLIYPLTHSYLDSSIPSNFPPFSCSMFSCETHVESFFKYFIGMFIAYHIIFGLYEDTFI